ncbi:MAG: bifunctional serine/threonine-protein kinase/formylglycine-generating enzyme family protein [Planctomycetes bacterium]|nr:bifunctional serine/threonine-protein kinase/formylglycine-generating enzyme family protein [Planctomycetota bacterium]
MHTPPDPDRDAAPGATTFGRFRLQRVLGQGGMGIVHLAFDPELRREVAVKLLRPELLAAAGARQRFEHEAQAAARLDHPSLCPVYEVGNLAGQPFLVLPYLPGETLAERFARERSDGTVADAPDRVAELLSILAQVAHALHHAHGAGLFHRDVKPGNILVRRDGAPVLLDFGLAQDADAEHEVRSGAGQTPGTPLYLAPEQLQFGARSDARTDVHGLGVTLYEGLTLQPPFGGRTTYELHQQILNQPTPEPVAHGRRCSRDLRALVAKATAKEPSHRYANCHELALDLQRCSRGEPIRARPLPAWQRLAYWIRRHPAATTLLLVLGAALAVTITLGRTNAALANELATRAAAETRQRRESERLQQLATERIDRFELLATPVQLDAFRREASALQSSGSCEVGALRAWLDRFAHELRPQLLRVERALAVGGADAGEPVAADAVAPAAVARFEQLRVRLVALRAAAAVRAQPDATVPAAPGPEAPPAFQALHAWALFANGYDQHAQRTMADAVAAARGSLQLALQWERQQLSRAQQQSAAELARTAAIVDHFAPAVADLRAPRRQDPADQVLWDTLQQARLEFRSLTEPGGLHAQIEQQWRWASALPELTEHHPAAAVSWAEAAAAIAAADGNGASTRYREVPIALRPQPGLVPIGKNPVTGLWEFYHLRSALDRADPEAARQLGIPRHRPDGSLELGPDAGIVFVLVPGGETVIGAQRTDPQGLHYDPEARAEESVRTGPVAPYLLARHELTQAQWLRLDPAASELSSRERNPSAYREGMFVQDRWLTSRNPVESVSWRDATARLTAQGLRLPTEWEWERACRAGSALPYGPDRTVDSLAGCENLLDQSTAANGWRGVRAPFDDGYVLHAPVGSFRANAFGMFDMRGNVAEFCSDRFAPTSELMVARGGRCSETVSEARSATRLAARPDSKGYAFGLRAALTLR